MKLPDHLGYSHMVETKIDQNIFLLKSELHLKQDIQIKTNSSINGLLLTFYFNGDMQYNSLLSDYKVKSKKNFTNISILNQEEGLEDITTSPLKSLNIVIKKEFLEQNFPTDYKYEKIIEALEEKNCAKNIKNSQTNIQTSLMAKELFHLQGEGNFERILLHAKVLELLYLEFHNMFDNKQGSKKRIILDDYDINAIHLAKDIMIDNMKNPPSIVELAQRVKLNEFKLKIGFKEVFHTTPYKLLHEYRMNRAKQLLENSDLNVTEISKEVGYKYIHSFSKVFGQRFGVLPKDVMKGRKYYY